MSEEKILEELAALPEPERKKVLEKLICSDGNVRALFSDAGQWAIHFSTVRMTLSTFFIGLSWTVISLKWDNFSFPLYYGAMVIWLITGFFLILFTYQTHKFSRQQKKFKNEMPTLGGSTTLHTSMHPLTCFGIWLPVLVFIFASWGYWELLEAWRARSASVQGFDAVATIGTSEIKFHATISSDLTAKMDEFSAKLDSQQKGNAKGTQPQPASSTIAAPTLPNTTGPEDGKK